MICDFNSIDNPSVNIQRHFNFSRFSIPPPFRSSHIPFCKRPCHNHGQLFFSLFNPLLHPPCYQAVCATRQPSGAHWVKSDVTLFNPILSPPPCFSGPRQGQIIPLPNARSHTRTQTSAHTHARERTHTRARA